MKKLFYSGIVFLILFEIANVFFVMPIPGSQEINSIDLAYFLYSFRWLLRISLGLLAVLTYIVSQWKYRWLPLIWIVAYFSIAGVIHYQMAADTMFYQPKHLTIQDVENNDVDRSRLVLGVEYNGYAKAYPIQFLGYHHQVRDTIGAKPIMVTYCTVCRTGRVYEPVVQGKADKFRLVGMDHFNAMFEDQSTKSWWRQSTGEAIAGPLKGQYLPEFPSIQTSLEKWITLHPHTKIMQADHSFKVEYDSMSTYEKGRLTGSLTRRDTGSWQSKSWVLGVIHGKYAKAYDWNQFQKIHVLNDILGSTPVSILVSSDQNSFAAFERNSIDQRFSLINDTLISENDKYNFLGKSLIPDRPDLKRIKVYQEYWHSWKTFHPGTLK